MEKMKIKWNKKKIEEWGRRKESKVREMMGGFDAGSVWAIS